MIKKIIKVVVFLLLLLFIGMTIFFLTFDINRYRERIAESAMQALGRPVSIGKIELKVSLIPTITLKEVELANAPWSQSQKPMAKIDSMNVSFAFMPLFRGNFEMKDFQIESMSLLLEKQGTFANWQFKQEKQAAQSAQKPSETPVNQTLPAFSADQIAIKRLNVVYQNNGVVQNAYLSDTVVRQLKAFSSDIIFNGYPFKISGTVDNMLNWLIFKPNYSFEIKLDAFNALFSMSGTIGNTELLKDIYANVQVSGADFNTFMHAFEKTLTFPSESFSGGFMLRGDLQKMAVENVVFDVNEGKSFTLNAAGSLESLTDKPALNISLNMAVPDEKFAAVFGVNPFSVSVDAHLLSNEVVLEKLIFYAGKSDLTGQASVNFAGKKPLVMADLNSEYFNLTDLVLEKAKAPKQQEKSDGVKRLFSDTVLNFDVLKKADASVSLNLKSVDVSSQLTEFISLNTKAQLKNGTLTIAPFSLGAIGGTTSGHIMVSAVDQPLVEVSLFSQNLQLNAIKPFRPIIQDMQLNSVVNLKTNGRSVRELMAHLNGHISMEVLSGLIVSPEFNSLPLPATVIRNQISPVVFSTSDQVSKIICGVVNMTVKDGQIKLNDSIALETSSVNFALSGDVNLVDEALSISIVPSIPSTSKKVTNQVLSLAQAVKISGPFTALKPSLDAASVSSTVAKAGLDILLRDKGHKPARTQTYELCDKAFGKKFPRPKKAAPVVLESDVAEKSDKSVSAKDQFKKDLLTSLSKALSE